jgi:hypothetical protein
MYMYICSYSREENSMAIRDIEYKISGTFFNIYIGQNGDD